MEKVYTLDKLDKKILKALMENARYSYSAIAKMVGTKREVVTYRIKRLVENGVIEQFTMSLNWTKIGFKFMPHIFMKLGIVSQERMQEITSKLCEHKYIIIVSGCEGTFNLYVRPLCKNETHLRKILNEIKTICGLDLLDYEIVDVLTDNYAPGLFFLDGEDIKLKNVIDKGGSFQSLLKKTYQQKSPTLKNGQLDSLDLKIFDLLQENSRISLRDLAKSTNSEIMTVKNRIQSLIKKKILYCFNLVLNTEKLGYQEYDLLIRLYGTEEEQKRVVQSIKNHKNCYYLALCNSRWDFLFLFQVKNTEELKKMINEILLKHKNVIVKYEIVWYTKLYKQISFPSPLSKTYHEKITLPLKRVVHPIDK
ncbi:MAG: Lrp/AsnC family transcriptional regulator [archaeon]